VKLVACVNDEDYGTLSEDTAAIYADAHVERSPSNRIEIVEEPSDESTLLALGEAVLKPS
jgi:hypothetical protein